MTMTYGCGSPSWGQIKGYDTTCPDKVIQNNWVSVAAAIVVFVTVALGLLSTFGILNFGVGGYACLGAAGLIALLLLAKNMLYYCLAKSIVDHMQNTHGAASVEGLKDMEKSRLQSIAKSLPSKFEQLVGFKKTSERESWYNEVELIMKDIDFCSNPKAYLLNFANREKEASMTADDPVGVKKRAKATLFFFMESLPKRFMLKNDADLKKAINNLV